jgi:hypothetical protein
MQSGLAAIGLDGPGIDRFGHHFKLPIADTGP